MPRKSAAATATLDPRGHRLEPPSGLSEAERAAFVAAVRSVKPGHFAAEDVPLLVAYAAATVQERAIARELEAAEDEDEEEKAKAKDRLQETAHGHVAGKPDEAVASLALGSDGAGAKPQPPPAWHGRAERPAAVGIPARG